MAVTPETGAEPATPETQGTGLMSEQEALSRISAMLEAPEGTQVRAEEQEEVVEETPQEAAEEEAQETEEPEAEEKETDESEPEADAEEIPDTLQGLAEALEITPEELSAHLKVPIKVNGKVSEVTLEEAIRGHQREQDYSRRTNEVAEERRQIEAQQAAFETQRTQALQEVGQLASVLEQRVNGITDDLLLKVLNEEGQEAYLQLDMQKKRDQALLGQVREQGQRLIHEQQTKLVEHRKAQQQKLVEIIPEFKDPVKAREVQGELTTYLEDQGFQREEVDAYFDGPFDARYIGVLRDAAKYRDLMAKSKKVGKTVKKQSKPRKAGSAVDHTPPSKLSSLRQRVRENRHSSRDKQMESGVAMISEMIRGK